jgi:hypothetical protein
MKTWNSLLSAAAFIALLAAPESAHAQTVDWDNNNPVWSTNPNAVSAKVVWSFPAGYTVDSVEIELYKVVPPNNQRIDLVRYFPPPALPLNSNATLSVSPLAAGEYYVVAHVAYTAGGFTGAVYLYPPNHTRSYAVDGSGSR